MSYAAPPLIMPPASADAATLSQNLPVGCYAELKRRVQQAGLLEPQPRYYARKIVVTVCLATIGVALLLVIRNPWLQALDAAYLAAVSAQFGFIGHDLGHHQVMHAGRVCTLFKLVCGNLLIGVSATWWMWKHNRHHSHPNRAGRDPDIMLPIVAFSVVRARAMNRWQQLAVRYQYLWLAPMLLFEGAILRLSSIEFLVRRRRPGWFVELLLIALHFGAYGWLVFHALGIVAGVVFVLVHQMAFGLYMGCVFAPNHKGMPVIEDDREVDFLLEQVLTARNVNPNLLVDFLYGGLNYQVEHHLFPGMARNKLTAAQSLVESFCLEHAIPYHRTGVMRSYREILVHLHRVGMSVGGRVEEPALVG